MPQAGAERFSSQNMADCEFCPEEGRRFRTMRQCAGCGRFLCNICRPWIPQVSFLCPDCGGGPLVNALHEPQAAIEQLTAAGRTPPYWLVLLRERVAETGAASAEEEVVPE